MALLDRHARIGVIGGGAMGSGIAQVAATHGHTVRLQDTDSAALIRATATILKSQERLVAKGRLTEDEAKAIRDRIVLTIGDSSDPSSLNDFHDCALVIEAVNEDLE